MIDTSCNTTVRCHSQIEILALPDRVHHSNRIEHQHVLSQIIASLIHCSQTKRVFVFVFNIYEIEKPRNRNTNTLNRNVVSANVVWPVGVTTVDSKTSHNGAFFEFMTLHFAATSAPSLIRGSNGASSAFAFVANSCRCNAINSSLYFSDFSDVIIVFRLNISITYFQQWCSFCVSRQCLKNTVSFQTTKRDFYYFFFYLNTFGNVIQCSNKQSLSCKHCTCIGVIGKIFLQEQSMFILKWQRTLQINRNKLLTKQYPNRVAWRGSACISTVASQYRRWPMRRSDIERRNKKRINALSWYNSHFNAWICMHMYKINNDQESFVSFRFVCSLRLTSWDNNDSSSSMPSISKHDTAQRRTRASGYCSPNNTMLSIGCVGWTKNKS